MSLCDDLRVLERRIEQRNDVSSIISSWLAPFSCMFHYCISFFIWSTFLINYCQPPHQGSHPHILLAIIGIFTVISHTIHWIHKLNQFGSAYSLRSQLRTFDAWVSCVGAIEERRCVCALQGWNEKMLTILVMTATIASVSPHTVIACDNTVLKISCNSGGKISITRANYGRYSVSVCNEIARDDLNIQCDSQDVSTEIMRTM